MQLECLLFDAQITIERRNDLDKAWHYEGKERNACQHDHDPEDFF